jgi:hypothetical protein
MKYKEVLVVFVGIFVICADARETTTSQLLESGKKLEDIQSVQSGN